MFLWFLLLLTQESFEVMFILRILGLFDFWTCFELALTHTLQSKLNIAFLRLPPPPRDMTTKIPCRWKLLPEVFLGMLYANKYA